MSTLTSLHGVGTGSGDRISVHADAQSVSLVINESNGTDEAMAFMTRDEALRVASALRAASSEGGRA